MINSIIFIDDSQPKKEKKKKIYG